VLVFLSGYVIVALEIVWVRLLGQFGQYHAYLFPTVLGTFLLADGLGMAWAARLLRRRRDPRPAFFLAQGLGFLLGLALLGVLWAAIGMQPLRDWMGVDFDRFGAREIAWSTAIIVAVVAPASFVIGMTFPFVQRAVQQDLASVGARVGWVQLSNILGNAAGSLLTGLITFHFLGTAGTLLLLCLLSLALLGFRIVNAREARPALLALFGLTALAAMAMPSNQALWARMHGIASDTRMAWGEDRSGVVLWREQSELPRREGGRFFIMGHGQGFVPFLDTHMLLGMLGRWCIPTPSACWPSASARAARPGAQPSSRPRARCAASSWWRRCWMRLRDIAKALPNSGVAALLADPRVKLEYGDGRRALTEGEGQYEVIEADAIRPQSSHSGCCTRPNSWSR
jgi:MFS family permease